MIQLASLCRSSAAVAVLLLVLMPLRVATSGQNVLFIAIDDLRTELGCYDRPEVRSPHLDQLAAQGTLFTRHFVQVPTCGASRYALLTGRSPHKSGALGNNALSAGPTQLAAEQQAGAQSLPELFRRSGYRTVCLGKISHQPDGKVYAYNGSGDGRPELPHAWDLLPTTYGVWKRGWGSFFAYAGGRHREDGGGHRDLMEFVATEDDDLPDGQLAAQAVTQLHELKSAGQPFFLAVGFFKPHLPFVAPRQDWDAFENADISLPEHPEKADSAYWYGSGEFYGYKAPFEKTRPLSQDAQKTSRRAYLACVRYVDRQVGRVLDALREEGLEDSTTVIVWGDHGWHLGDSAIWGKHSPLERALKSTLIIRAPGTSRPGTICGALVETLDLYPTLIDLCQPRFTETVHPLDGLSLRPLLTGDAREIRPAAISYWGKSVSIRTLSHRLIYTQQADATSKVELYALASGDDPIHNLAAENAGLVEKLLRHRPDRVSGNSR